MVIIHIYSPKWLMTTGVREKRGEGGWEEGRVVYLRTTVAHCKKKKKKKKKIFLPCGRLALVGLRIGLGRIPPLWCDGLQATFKYLRRHHLPCRLVALVPLHGRLAVSGLV